MTILDRLWQEPVAPSFVVLDLSAAPYVDLQSAHALAGLARDRLRGEGLDGRLGGINRFISVADAVDRL